MEKIDIIAKIFSNLDNFFIFIINEADISIDKDIDDIHTFVKMIYEKSTHPMDSYHDNGTGRKDWNEVLRLLKNDFILERTDQLFTKYLSKLSEEDLDYLRNDHVSEENIVFIKNNLSKLYDL